MESLENVLKLARFSKKEGIPSMDDMVAEVKRHPFFLTWQEEQGLVLDESYIRKSLPRIVQYIREMENCRHCPGIERCPNVMPGYQPRLQREQEYIDIHLRKCNKKIAQEERDTRQKLIRSHHVPREIMEADFHSIEPDAGRIDALEALLAFCHDYQSGKEMSGLYFHGPLGVGKSRLMAAGARKLAERGIPSLMVYTPDFFREMKEAIGDHTLTEKIQALKTVAVLILDDIGAESMSAWARDEVLGSILQHRILEGTPTLFTSNFDYDELEEHFSYSHKAGLEAMKAKRVMERIRHYTKAYFVDGPNRRKNRKG